jgi:hypothetical protein
MIDVLYLIPYDHQERLIRAAFAGLASGGTLLVKTMGRVPRWKFAWNYFEETLAVRLLKITRGQSFYFRSSRDWEQLLAAAGFSVSLREMDRGHLHPHLLVIGRKR